MAATKRYEVVIPAGTDPEEGLALAREKAAGIGIRLEGDSESGSFSGAAAGTYRREGERLFFEVSKKPFFVSWGMIRSQLEKVFDEVILHA